MDEIKLKPFEKLLQTIEGKLMEGQIFRVSVLNVRTCVNVCVRMDKENFIHLKIIVQMVLNFCYT